MNIISVKNTDGLRASNPSTPNRQSSNKGASSLGVGISQALQAIHHCFLVEPHMVHLFSIALRLGAWPRAAKDFVLNQSLNFTEKVSTIHRALVTCLESVSNPNIDVYFVVEMASYGCCVVLFPFICDLFFFFFNFGGPSKWCLGPQESLQVIFILALSARWLSTRAWPLAKQCYLSQCICAEVVQ